MLSFVVQPIRPAPPRARAGELLGKAVRVSFSSSLAKSFRRITVEEPRLGFHVEANPSRLVLSVERDGRNESLGAGNVPHRQPANPDRSRLLWTFVASYRARKFV